MSFSCIGVCNVQLQYMIHLTVAGSHSAFPTRQSTMFPAGPHLCCRCIGDGSGQGLCALQQSFLLGDCVVHYSIYSSHHLPGQSIPRQVRLYTASMLLAVLCASTCTAIRNTSQCTSTYMLYNAVYHSCLHWRNAGCCQYCSCQPEGLSTFPEYMSSRYWCSSSGFCLLVAILDHFLLLATAAQLVCCSC